MLTCAEGAALNVRINLAGMDDTIFDQECRKTMDQALGFVREKCKEIISLVEQNI